MVLECVCKEDRYGNKQSAGYQDNRYGRGRRVHNTKKDGTFRCTVCGRETTK